MPCPLAVLSARMSLLSEPFLSHHGWVWLQGTDRAQHGPGAASQDAMKGCRSYIRQPGASDCCLAAFFIPLIYSHSASVWGCILLRNATYRFIKRKNFNLNFLQNFQAFCGCWLLLLFMLWLTCALLSILIWMDTTSLPFLPKYPVYWRLKKTSVWKTLPDFRLPCLNLWSGSWENRQKR